MKKLFFITTLFLFLTAFAFAQKENNIWYFGEYAGLDFNSGSPVDLSNGMLYTEEGCSSISDANGNLLFYTDGVRVWDKNHNQMPNGFGLLGEFHSTQSALIVPFPASSSMFYIFTVRTSGGSFNYSIVDMSLNGGNGDVTVKNFMLKMHASEKLCGVRHSNNTDAWIMVHSFQGDTLFAYSITGSGVSSIPVINKIGHVFSGNDYRGYMKFSADGTKLAFAAYDSSYVDLFDFDASTGIVSNEKYLTLPAGGIGAYGIEFSLSGHYLYATKRGLPYIYQWDISSNNETIINATLVQIGNMTPSISALQMAPDGKIYVSQSVATYYIGVINYPESPGVSCNYIKNYLSLSGSCFYGLPNFMASFLTTGINTNTPRPYQFTISPNPASDEITITSQSTINKIEIFNLRGEQVYHQQLLTSDFRLPISDFPNGLYIIKAYTEKGVFQQKLLVNH